MPDVRRLVRDDPPRHPLPQPRVFSRDSRCHDAYEHLELAIGWPEGLSFLVSKDFCPVYAISCACLQHDDESLRHLLRSKHAIFANPREQHWYPEKGQSWVFQFASRSGSLNIMQLVVDEFASRRKGVNDLALQHLTLEEKRVLEVSPLNTLDRHSRLVYEMVTSRTHVPAALDCCNMTSAYDFLSFAHRVELSDLLYEAGFKDIDQPDDNGTTPLLRVIHRALSEYTYSFSLMGSSYPESLIETAIWYLLKDANPVFHVGGSDNWPNVLFYLATFLQTATFRSLIPSLRDGLSPRTRSLFRSLYNFTDGCKCLCSVRGCLAAAMFWRCGHSEVLHCNTRRKDRITALQSFIVLCGLRERQISALYRDLFRLEAFERLGVTHTCCACNAHNIHNLRGPRAPLPDVERELIQDEQRTFAIQLNMLIAEYDRAWAMYDGSAAEFWKLWWDVLDAILPPLNDEEACQNHLMSMYQREVHPNKFRELQARVSEKRAAREREALIGRGYDPNTDFTDIIKSHLVKYRKISNADWLTESECDASSDSEMDGWSIGGFNDRPSFKEQITYGRDENMVRVSRTRKAIKSVRENHPGTSVLGKQRTTIYRRKRTGQRIATARRAKGEV